MPSRASSCWPPADNPVRCWSTRCTACCAMPPAPCAPRRDAAARAFAAVGRHRGRQRDRGRPAGRRAAPNPLGRIAAMSADAGMSGDLSGNSMLDLFRMEAQEQTRVLTDGLLRVERGKQDRALLEALMRAATRSRARLPSSPWRRWCACRMRRKKVRGGPARLAAPGRWGRRRPAGGRRPDASAGRAVRRPPWPTHRPAIAPRSTSWTTSSPPASRSCWSASPVRYVRRRWRPRCAARSTTRNIANGARRRAWLAAHGARPRQGCAPGRAGRRHAHQPRRDDPN
jgi:hypothetical protein